MLSIFPKLGKNYGSEKLSKELFSKSSNSLILGDY